MIDTICAPATPLVTSAVIIIRISGFELKEKLQPLVTLPKPKQAALRTIKWDKYKDNALIIFFEKPKSYTGEDLVEIHLHGNPLLAKHLLDYLNSIGIRLAKPGEFTKRALLNGKQTLLDVETLRDLINATTDTQLRHTQAKIGGVPDWINYTKDVITTWLATAEADIDYGEDDNIILDIEKLKADLHPLKTLLNLEQKRSNAASWLTYGIKIAIIGPPNSGKSTLFNKLLGYDRAITANIPGTTRDILEARVDWAGLPLTLFDTAGLRHSKDPIESLGIERVYGLFEKVDLILCLIPITENTIDQKILNTLKPFLSKLIVINSKADLDNNARTNHPCISSVNNNFNALVEVLQKRFLGDLSPDMCLGALATKRQREIVDEIIFQLEMISTLNNQSPSELAASALQGIWKLITDLTGEDRVDSTLDHIFSTFCLGK